ncbi:TIR domain-containing protein [Erythrobacter sp. R86502]|uniref:TIR domain-containing protein n=1 Tax=Erythrobacter sp. R86502 TaxID=3093846 RepID=UPI0036D41254
MAGENGVEDTDSGRRPSVFVSYSRTDLDRSRPVIALLEDAGFDVWWDGKLEGGENYLATTETALETADCVVVLWSQVSVASHWVRDEAQRGRERGCLVPLSLDGTMAPLGFRQFQLLDIAQWSGDPEAEAAKRILVAVGSKTGEQACTTPSVPWQPRRAGAALLGAQGPAISRRGALIGGAGLAGVAALGAGWAAGLFGPATAGAVSMVVLPFANLTGDDSKTWFSDGLSNALRAVLVRNPRLKVAAPTSSSAIQGEDEFAIGRKLGVEHILRGNVQRDAARMRVSAELVEIEGGLVRWAETYDRVVDDVFALQSEIAETVATSLVAQVASSDEVQTSLAAQKEIGGTRSVAAYDAFLRGVAIYKSSTGSDTDRDALAQFDTAIAQDAGYAAAHAMRSTALAAIANAASSASEIQRLYVDAIAAAERAIAIEPKFALGHLALGFALNNGQLQRSAAAQHYRAAEQLAPGDADVLRGAAIFHSYGKDQARAAQMIARALTLDPLNARAFLAAGFIALFARDYPKVIQQMEQALSLNSGIPSAHFGIANARYLQGDLEGAQAAAAKEPVRVFELTLTAITAAKRGDNAAADAAQTALIGEYGDACLYQQAQIAAQRGAVAEAIAVLERAYTTRDPGVLFARNDPMLDPLRKEDGFKELLRQLGS